MPYRQRQNSYNFGLKLFNGTPKCPYKFKEIISLILLYVELIM